MKKKGVLKDGVDMPFGRVFASVSDLKNFFSEGTTVILVKHEGGFKFYGVPEHGVFLEKNIKQMMEGACQINEKKDVFLTVL